MSWLTEFLDSFALFGSQYAAGWLAAVTLALAGVLVVAERKVFVGAAAAQSSILGCAIALVLADLLGVAEEHWARSETFATVLAVAFAVLATLLVAGAGDVRAAVVFLASSSLAILVVSKSPHGLEEVHRIVASSLLGATWSDAGVFAVLLALGALGALAWRKPLLLVAMDPKVASAIGLPVRRANLLVAVYTGTAVGMAIRCTGLLYAFGMLVLPTLIAAQLARRSAALFWLAPVVALGLAVPGFVLAHHFDLPPGQLTVALGCVGTWGLTPITHYCRMRRSRR